MKHEVKFPEENALSNTERELIQSNFEKLIPVAKGCQKEHVVKYDLEFHRLKGIDAMKFLDIRDQKILIAVKFHYHKGEGESTTFKSKLELDLSIKEFDYFMQEKNGQCLMCFINDLTKDTKLRRKLNEY